MLNKTAAPKRALKAVTNKVYAPPLPPEGSNESHLIRHRLLVGAGVRGTGAPSVTRT